MSGGITLLRVVHSESGKVVFINGPKRTVSGHHGLTGMRRAESSYEAIRSRKYVPFHANSRSMDDLRINTNGSAPRIPPKDPIITGKMKKPAPSVPSIITSPVDSIPEEDITIPNDGCLHNFTADEMATFFRYMRVEDRLINHMHRKGLDGKKFSRLKDSEMDGLGLNNPIIKYFREKSMKRTKGRMPFLL
ncbi:uncharacterized protein [Haliotis cracherodii]|uniref:uncharacterized protein isoform X2 n=1 Tax=Haliotis cracherodii TaxID=6455 RepID=UPI0039E8A144